MKMGVEDVATRGLAYVSAWSRTWGEFRGESLQATSPQAGSRVSSTADFAALGNCATAQLKTSWVEPLELHKTRC